MFWSFTFEMEYLGKVDSYSRTHNYNKVYTHKVIHNLNTLFSLL